MPRLPPWIGSVQTCPNCVDEHGDIILAVQMLIIETASGTRIAVDTCIGDNKTLPGTDYHKKQGSFLQDLESAGCPPDNVDWVLCTHLHFDHVGFNTTLCEGKWLPTFPKAKYLFAKKEWEAYEEEMAGEGKAFIGNSTVFKESLQPIVDAGLHELVSSDHVLVDDGSCRIYLMPTEGHTEGHVSVVIESGGKSAIITGDAIHHPAQLACPHLGTFYDCNSASASDTRESLFQRVAEHGTVLIGTHFPAPTAGYLEKGKPGSGRAFRFCPFQTCTSKTCKQPAAKKQKLEVSSAGA